VILWLEDDIARNECPGASNGGEDKEDLSTFLSAPQEQYGNSNINNNLNLGKILNI